MTAQSATCPAPGTTERYLLGELSDGERDAFEGHYFECATCAADVRAAAALVEGAEVVLQPPAASARAAVAAPPRWRWLGLPARFAGAAALALLVVTGYQTLVVVPALRQELAVRDSPRALVATTLRPATRGQVPTVSIPPGQPFVTLALEAPAATGLHAELRDEGDRLVLGPWAVARPPEGEPLQLLVPAARLAAGRYALVLKSESEGGNSRELDRYPFALERSR